MKRVHGKIKLLGLIFILLAILGASSRREIHIENILVEGTGGRSSVTLAVSQPVGSLGEAHWIDAPPPGSGLPSGRYMELYMPHIAIGESFISRFDRPIPIRDGPMRAMFIVAPNASSMVLYFHCLPQTQFDIRKGHRKVQLVFSAGSK